MRFLLTLLACAGLVPLFAAEVKLDAAVFGEVSARNIGPATMSGRTTDIVGTPDQLYFATASGGVWRSTDGGISVTQIFDDHTQAIGCIAVDPNDAKVLWVGTGEINTRNSTSVGDGVYKSTDGGESWTHMGLKESERIGRIIVHPDNSDVVYVAALGKLWGDHEERGLYKTTDGGKTWEVILQKDATTGCVDVDMDPQEPDTLYAAMWQVRRQPHFFESGGPGSGLFKSTDGGKTWNELRSGLPEGDFGRIDLDIAPSRPNRLYAMVESEKTGLYRSDDAGASWEMVNNSSNMVSRPFYLSIIKVDPADHNRVYNPSFSLTISTDGGKSFGGSMFGSGVHPDFQAIWINPDNPKHVIVGTDGGAYVSYDHADNWRHITTLPASQFYHVSVDDARPYNVYGGLQDNGSWMAPSAYPGGITNAQWKNLGGGDGFHVASDRTDSRYKYWTVQGGILNRYDSRTGEQRDIRAYPEEGMAPNRYNWNAGFAQSPTGPAIYHGSQYLYKSMDRGDSWQRISFDLTSNDPEKLKQEESGGLTPDVTAAENHCTIFTIAESPKDENVIWVGTDDGNLQVSKDGGKNWALVVANVPDLPAATWVSTVEASPHDAATAFVTFDGHRNSDFTPYAYKTTDYGETWTRLSSEGVLSYAHVIRQDYVNPDLLFLGTEMGLYISMNGGADWVPFTGGLPDKVSVKDMVFQKREHDLVLGTHGRGIFIIDDLTPLRALKVEDLARNAVLLPSRPSFSGGNGGPSFNYAAQNVYSGKNPEDGMIISYYLKKRHIFGKLSLEIYNEAGDKVATLSGGKRRGINRVAWAMRQKPPRSARSRSLNFGSFIGPMVPEGRYTVKLVRGKETLETEVELKLHPLMDHTPEERKLQHETVMKLYNTQEDLAFVGDSIADLRTQIGERLEGVKKGRLKKVLAEKDQKLDTLQATLVDNSQSGSIFASKERLRDEVINLYAAVAGYLGKPSQNQLNEMNVLMGRVDEATESFTALSKLDDLNKQLGKAKLAELTLLDRKAWDQKEEKERAGADMAPAGKMVRTYHHFFQNLSLAF